MQRLVGGLLVGVRLRFPEPASRPPDVPLRQVVDECGEGPRGAGHVVVGELRVHRLDQAREPRQQPAVQRRPLGEMDRRPRGIEAVDHRVVDVERVAVPQRQQELLHRLLERVGTGAVVLAHRHGRVEVPPHGVGAERVEQVVRVEHVAARLRMLLAFRVHDQAEADDVAVRVLLEKQGRDRQQRVEPAARLVERLADEVRRERLLEQLRVVPGVAVLRKRHRAGVEPAVEHLGHAAHDAAAVLTRDGDLVDVRAVQVEVFLEPELGGGADTLLLLALLAHPERQRRAPVARARDRPVDVVLEPVAHATGLDMRRNPVGVQVVEEQLGLVLRRLHVPGIERVIDQRRAASPALGVRVQDRLRLVEQLPFLQVVLDQRVRVLYSHAIELLHIGEEVAGQVHGVRERDAERQAELQVVDAIERRRVHDAGSFLGGDEVGWHDVLGAALLRHRVGVDRLVVEVD